MDPTRAADSPTPISSFVAVRRPWTDPLNLSVIVAVVLTPVLPALILANYAALHGTPWEPWAVRAFFGAEGWAGLGGVLMTTRNRNAWWLLTTLVALAVPAAIFWAASQLGTLTLH